MNKRKRTLAALLAIAIFAVVGASLDKGSLLGIFDRTRLNASPSDEENNLFYSRKKPCTSENVLDRSGFAFLNLGERIVAVELASGVNVTVVEKAPERERYRKFSEYAGYVYLYDGDSLWRTGIDGSRVSRIADGVVEYEPMGNYVYFLKWKDGAPRLFRSWLTGSGQEMLFKHPVHEFHAFAGSILMLREPRRQGRAQYFTSYSVLDQRSADLRLPAEAEHPWSDGRHLYYVVASGDERVLYRRSLDGSGAAERVAEGFLDCQVGPDGIAMLVREGNAARLVYQDRQTLEARRFDGRLFPCDSAVDLSWDRVYVTGKDGVYHSPVKGESWRRLPVAGELPEAARMALPVMPAEQKDAG